MPRRKTAHELKISGQFRADRHADRLNVPAMSGEPAKPADLDPVAGELWDSIVPELVAKGYVAAIDVPLIRCACEMWALFRAAMSAALADPVDKLARTAATNYWTCFDKAAARIGLSPEARQKLPRQVAPGLSSIEAFARDRDKGRFFDREDRFFSESPVSRKPPA